MNFFKNIKIAQKISLIAVSFIISIVIIGVTSVGQLSHISSKIMEITNSRMEPIIALEDTKSNVEYIRTEAGSLMGSTGSTKTTVLKNISDKVSKVDAQLAKHKNDKEFTTLLKHYKKFITAKDEFIKSANQMKTQNAADSKNNKASGAAGNAKNEKSRMGMRDFDNAELALINDFNKVINVQLAAARQIYKDSRDSYNNTLVAFLLILLICVGITLALSVFITKSITIPIKKVTLKLKEISESNGNLTQRIGYSSKDEIGQLGHSFDLFMEKLHSIIGEVAASAETIASSSSKLNSAASASTHSLKEISETVRDIAAGATEEAAAIEETTASLAEAANFSEATSSSSKNTSYNSKKAKEAAENGAVKISQIVSSITEISQSSKEVSDMIGDLSASSKKIGDIIEIITSISEQTNLLALNAAIEAARAGEAGKGFNVVAEEIRKLADESKKAASEISQLVNENQVKSNSAVNSFENVKQKVSLGVSQASEVGESIQNIIKNIKNIAEEIDHINQANEQQSDSTKEIEKAISNIADTTNEVADKTDNISRSVENQLNVMTQIEDSTQKLSDMVDKLNSITSGFVV